MILHDATKTIQNGVFVYFFKKKNKNLFFKKNNKKSDLKNWWVVCFFKWVFLNPDCLSILFVTFP